MENLRAMRQLAGLTQISLSRRAGVSRMRLQLAEAGQVSLRAEEEASLRSALREAITKQAERLQGVLASTEAARVTA
jgi:transcriptional regulator with XRE-family HTH domain